MRRTPLLAFLTLMAGCTVGPDYHASTPLVPEQFHAATQPAATQPAAEAGDLRRWWEVFGDATLNRLVDQTVAANLDVRLAEARVREARAGLAVARGALGPTVDATASATRSHTSNNAPLSGVPGTSNLFEAGFDAAWEVDVFGGTRRAVESASYTLEAQVEARRNALVTLLGEVAQDYVNFRGYQQQLDVVRRNVAAQRDTLDLQRSKLKAGLATDLDVAQAEAQVEGTEAQIPPLRTLAQESVHALSVLSDQEPGALQAMLDAPAPLPVAAGVIPPGLPSELLRRRPDVRQAERQLAAATADIGVAVADLYPKFDLTGALGLESDKLRRLARSSSLFWSVEPAMDWRLFDTGQTRANIRVFEARRDEAAIQYRQAVLQALQDVENALVAYSQEQVRQGSLQRQVDANRRAVDLALRLNKSGLVDFLNVLTTQQSLYEAQVQLAQSEQSLSTDLVALYKALGGGWETLEPQGASAH